MPEGMPSIEQQTDHLFRQVSGKVVAVLTRQFGVDKIEEILDAVQDAFEAALIRWRFSGVPNVPEAWLLTVARRKLINQQRRMKRITSLDGGEMLKEEGGLPKETEVYIRDSQLALLLLCVNLPLSTRDRIITTLHILCGFSPYELAKAMDVQYEAVRKSLYRNKQKLAAEKSWQNIKWDDSQMADHKSTIHEVLYALFNEGYKSAKPENGIDMTMCYEAVRLLSTVMEISSSSESHGLMSLFYFHLSRFPARLDAEGIRISIEHQDRSLWDKALIKAGCYHLKLAKPEDELNTRYLEAIIASLHTMAPSFDETPWHQIEDLYTKWHSLDNKNGMLKLQALTAALYHRPDLALVAEIENLKTELSAAHHYLVDATLAEMYSMLGDNDSSNRFLQRAIERCEDVHDKKFLQNKLIGKKK